MIAPPFHRLFNVGALTGDLQKSQPTLKRGAQGERLDGIERCCLSAKNYFTTNLLSSYGTRSTMLSSLKTKRSEKVTHAVTRTYAQADQPTLKSGGRGGKHLSTSNVMDKAPRIISLDFIVVQRFSIDAAFLFTNQVLCKSYAYKYARICTSEWHQGFDGRVTVSLHSFWEVSSKARRRPTRRPVSAQSVPSQCLVQCSNEKTHRQIGIHSKYIKIEIKVIYY